MTRGRDGGGGGGGGGEEGSKYEKMLPPRSFDVKSDVENQASIVSKYFVFKEAFMSLFPPLRAYLISENDNTTILKITKLILNNS